jgi:tetratricopeptide (TPR) repeat protein
VLAEEGKQASGDKSVALFDQAVRAYRSTLEVRTKAGLPQAWATTQFNLGVTLNSEGALIGKDKAAALYDQAAQAFRSVLEVITRDNMPTSWANAQFCLGNTLEAESEHVSGEKVATLLDQAATAFQNALQVYTRADFPTAWPGVQMALMEVDLLAAHFATCLQVATPLKEATLSPELIPVRDATYLACEWGAGNKNSALAMEKTLLAEASQSRPDSWDFIETNHFLSNSPAFENGRPAWIALFTALQNGDASGATAALHQLDPLF